MTGKRLLDAAVIIKASRGVASKHVALRKHQLDSYSKTSSLAKAVKSQTDRFTLTVKAASALTKCFNEQGPRLSTSAFSRETSRKDEPVPSQKSVEGADGSVTLKQGEPQDQFYERSRDNATAEPPPNTALNVKQEKAKGDPLPDGSISPQRANKSIPTHDKEVYSELQQADPGEDPLRDPQGREQGLRPTSSGRTSIPEPAGSRTTQSADQLKISQRQAEKQIPSLAAEPPPAKASDLEAREDPESEDPAISVSQEQDNFYTPPTSNGRVLSALPRVKLPRVTENVQESDENIPDAHINQNVYYSSTPKDQEQSVAESQAVPEQEQPPEEAYSEIFQSPRIAKMMRGQPGQASTSKGIQLPSAKSCPVKQGKTAEENEQGDSSMRTQTQDVSQASSAQSDTPTSLTSEQEGEHDVQSLAVDIAKDTEDRTFNTKEIPEDLERESSKAPYDMHESRVPSSRFGRLWQYSGLAASMTFGAVGESFRRATGSGGDSAGSLMLSAGNMERLVAKLSRMRGAALKLGQMMSFQDSKMLPAPIHEVLQRVQDSADYMPASQRNRVLADNLGSDWRNLFSSFDEKPIAAASIGQVHSATLKSTGQRVAVKVQYPGVASSIDSDLSNLSLLLTASRLLPKGLYLDKTIANARTELAWECDYIREAKMGARFRDLLADETDIFHVPAIISEASGPTVLTAEYCSGVGVTKVQTFTQDQKDWIGTHILRLCLREITEFKFMQTDPNWTNFLYNAQTNKLELLDFGASRDFPDKFIKPYILTLLAASRSDRNAVRDLSIQLGYLTGHESQTMVNAHVNSVLTLAEPFMDTTPEIYDFRDQTITDRVRGFIPVMVRERLAPPPEETYSLHRKLSGAFLLCARLGSRVRCREMFQKAMVRAGVV